MSVNSKVFKILYRLTLPGGLLLVFAAVLIRVGILADATSPLSALCRWQFMLPGWAYALISAAAGFSLQRWSSPSPD